jgi:hypothetical protein
MNRRDAYLERLWRELRRQFIVDPRAVEEARAHLEDAADRARRDGATPDAADDLAIARFGPPDEVAAAYAAGRTRNLYRWILAAACLAGAAVAYVDSRPGWDDAGMTAGAMLLAAAACGIIGPRRPWTWALAVGLWIPASAIARAPTLGSAAMLVTLAFPFAGAYAGRFLRRLAMGALS